MFEVQPGDRVQVIQRWATTAHAPVPGTVTKVFTSSLGGTWASVRFDGERAHRNHLLVELEPADR